MLRNKNRYNTTTFVHLTKEKISEDFGLAKHLFCSGMNQLSNHVQPAVQNHHASTSHVSLPGLSQASGCVTSTSYLPFVHWSPNLESLRLLVLFPSHWAICSSSCQATALSHLWSAALGRPYWHPPAPKQGPAEKQRNPSRHLAASSGLMNRYGQELNIFSSALTPDMIWYACMIR